MDHYNNPTPDRAQGLENQAQRACEVCVRFCVETGVCTSGKRFPACKNNKTFGWSRVVVDEQVATTKQRGEHHRKTTGRITIEMLRKKKQTFKAA